MRTLQRARLACVAVAVACVAYIYAVDGTFSLAAWAEAMRP